MAKTFRLAKHLKIASIILLILGIGNIIYGNAKTKEYLSVLQESTSAVPSLSESERGLPVLGRYISLDEQLNYYSAVKSKIDFYRFTIRGGKAFLALSLLCAIGTIIFR
ncbi:MAG: hypothetical protein D6808_02680 [Candidatus Dadabacteria bacterium]|nr:MAG: hypothetical protein D6808_02680 [Candidatus Dadabacteria bacterium]